MDKELTKEEILAKHSSDIITGSKSKGKIVTPEGALKAMDEYASLQKKERSDCGFGESIGTD